MNTTRTNIQSIVIVGRLWFDKANGNTYHTSEAIVDGESLFKTEMEYGYGEQYIETAFDKLEEMGLISREQHANGSKDPAWRWCEGNGVKLNTQVFDVLKRDL